ncbi:YkvI family membrane protein [Alkalicoccobacillus gibsonii]|uniref:YkvI family membrane protein n=1 Tax=Alkalicoccobacillus gibsonii TaxID=79881 RepID=UPI003F7C1C05
MWANGLKWMFLIVGTLIGAGYASGRELWQFFGAESNVAILLFTGLFTVSCFVILNLAYKQKSTQYVPLLTTLVGPKLARFYDWIILSYLFSTTTIMLAGAGATLEVYNIPFWLGMVGTAAFVVLLFLRDTKGMTTINAFLIPILILSLVSILLVFQSSLGFSFSFDVSHQSNWPSAITFTALNILPIVAVVSAIGNQISHRGEIWIATIGSGLLMGSISYLYNESLLQIANEIMFYEIPLFVILKQYPSVMVVAMSVLLWLAIYTTAGAGIFGLISRLRGVLKGETWLVAMLLLAIMAPLTTFGFSSMIAVLYPLYGAVNLYLLVAIILYPFFRHPMSKKTL